VTAIGALLVLTLAASCTGADGEETTGTPVRVALDFFPNTNHIGMYVADELGYYDEAGIALEVIPYAGTFPAVLLSNGRADFGFSYQADIAYSRSGGSDIQQVFANVARSQYAISVRADRDDITRPRDLDGKIYAGFGTADEVPALTFVIRADGGTGDFTSVPLDLAAYEAIYAGRADFTYSVKTWDGIQADLAERPVKYFEFADYGFPAQYSTAIAASQAWLADNPDLARAFLAATQRGYEYAAADPAEAADLLLAAEPDAFANPELVRASAQVLAAEDYYTDGSPAPIGTVEDAVWQEYGSFLFDNGLLTDADRDVLTEEPDWAQYYTNDYLPAP